MRILHVTPSLSHEWGGPPMVIAGLTSALKLRGVDCSVFTSTGRRVGEQDISLDVKSVFQYRTGPLARAWTGHGPGVERALRTAIADTDIVHVHELWHYPHYAAANAARRSGTPYLVTLHGELDPWAIKHHKWRKKIYWMLVQKRLLNGAAAIHAITSEEIHQMSALGIDTPATVIPNGINAEPFGGSFGGTISDSLSNRLRDKRVILFLGRLHRKKGLDLLIRAFRSVRDAYEDVVLVIAGPDENGYQKYLEDLAQVAGVEDRTIFTGLLADEMKVGILHAADLFVLPSYSEGFSIAVLEAMAAGLPVLISRQCYFPEVSEEGAGIVVETDTQQLASAMSQLLERPEDRRSMGEAGRNLVRERYTWPSIAQKMSTLYASILADKSRSAGLSRTAPAN